VSTEFDNEGRTRTRIKKAATTGQRANFRITSRDIRVLLSVAENQYLTTSQICVLRFPSLHRARKRLNILWKNGFLQRMIVPRGLETLPAEAVYFIGRSGRRLLTAHGELTEPLPIPKPTRRPGSFMFLSHTLMRNSLRIALEQSVRSNSKVTLRSWKHDASITRRVLAPDHKAQRLTSVPLRADAYFQLEASGSATEFYLEVDNGSMAVSRLMTKMNGYHIWRRSRIHAATGQRPSLRVLVLVFSRKRAQHIVERLVNLARAQMATPLWLVAYVERDDLIRARVLEDVRWSRPTFRDVTEVTLLQELDRFAARQND